MKIKIEENIKRKIKIGIIILLGILIILITSLYLGNQQFRTFFNRYILRKELIENNVIRIDLTTIENPSIYAYDKYIAILSKNQLTTYSSTGKKEYEHEIEVSDALFASNNRFLAIAQKNGQNVYLISETNLIWQVEVEGNIQKININKNGYVSVITTGNSYKTVVITYSPEGKELFKTYLSSSIAIDTSISYDNKYLALAEIDTSGSTIQSSIKIISLEKAQNTPKESVIQKQKQQVNRLITDIEYQDKNKILILCDDGIYTLDESSQNQKLAFEKSKITFASINLNNYMAYSIEKKSGLFTNTQVNLKNINTDKENIYTTGGTIKDIKTSTNKIALNLGSQVEFINTLGWEIKKYVSEKEITDIVIADNIAGIVYKDKIEIINL